MQGVCDYTAILDHRLGTPHGFDNTIRFEIPPNAVLSVHSILAFTISVKLVHTDKTMPLKVKMNQHEVASYILGHNYFGPLVKVIDPHVLGHGTNHMFFAMDCSDTGGCEVEVDDIALWWFKSTTA